MEQVTIFFGDSYQSISEVDYISISLGIALGLLLGEIPIPLFGGGSFKLGFAAGTLIVSLILGKLGRTGRMVWVMSYNSNLTVRQLGVVLFLAGIGLKAGYSFGLNMQKYGMILFLAGFILTLLNTILFMLLARFFFKTPYLLF
jgi:putative transport protein